LYPQVVIAVVIVIIVIAAIVLRNVARMLWCRASSRLC
jgi:hypothetical protein